MKTLRALFYLLLAADIVLAALLLLPMAGVQLPWTPIGEAERLTHQLSPEKIQIRTEQSAPLPVISANAPASTADQPAATPSTEQDTDICVRLSRLTTKDTQQLSDLATLQQPNGVTIQVGDVAPPSYWVYIPPSGGLDGANKRAAILTKIGIEDYSIVRDAGPTQFSVSLGLFRNEDAANRLLDAVHKKNIKSARIAERDNTGNNAHAELTGPQSQLTPLIKDFLGKHKDAQRDACSSN
jgi:hypothetical protein